MIRKTGFTILVRPRTYDYAAYLNAVGAYAADGATPQEAVDRLMGDLNHITDLVGVDFITPAKPIPL